ncbi:hypothetical protein SASPL_116487 [Salvia splendens]|uniref:Laccase n=1 Tax=Salvia splendens TaxID=180675 RepID=A0A8X8XXX5_SALSN|nr:hypothetical protein SASPL_116487 [Salvia splendens]
MAKPCAAQLHELGQLARVRRMRPPTSLVFGEVNAVRFYKFEVVNSSHTRLCTKKTMLTINGQFPGPTIYARRGDLITVDIVNQSDQNITIHCARFNRKSFTQRMILSDEEGTLWWHAHSAWSRNSVHGAIVILPSARETYPFPKPHAMFPSSLTWEPPVRVRCSSSTNAATGTSSPEPSLIASAAPASLPDFCTGPLETSDFAWPDHRFDSRSQPAAKPLLHGGPNICQWWRIRDNIPATGIIEYVGNYKPPPSPLLPSFPEYNDSAASIGFTDQLKSLGNNVDIPKEVDETFFYTLSVNQFPCTNPSCSESTRLLASVNNMTLLLPKTIDILTAYYRGIRGVYTPDFPDFPTPLKEESRSAFGTEVRILEYNTMVEVVFQGTNLGRGVEHPMHLHGYSFYVVGSGLGNYDRIRDLPNYNLVDPPLMENIAVPRNGWTAIRFKANNPGVWYMHCHFERHVSWGMAMVFIVKDGERPNEKMLPPPPDMPGCGGKVSSPPLVFGGPDTIAE